MNLMDIDLKSQVSSLLKDIGEKQNSIIEKDRLIREQKEEIQKLRKEMETLQGQIKVITNPEELEKIDRALALLVEFKKLL